MITIAVKIIMNNPRSLEDSQLLKNKSPKYLLVMLAQL